MCKKFLLFIFIFTYSVNLFAITKEVQGHNYYDCKSPDISSLIVPKILPYTKGNRKHVDLTYCRMYFSGDVPLIKLRVYILSKDQAKVKLGFIKITKTLYEYGATIDISFKLNPNNCATSLEHSFVDYHSEGVMSLPFRGALRLTRRAVNLIVEKQVKKFLAKKNGQITQYCVQP